MGASLDILRQSHLFHEVEEDDELSLPDGDKKVVRAWYGDPESKWKEVDGKGRCCTAKVKELLHAHGSVAASNEALGMDPAGGVRKVLLLQLMTPDLDVYTCVEKESLLIPGGAENVLRAWYGDPAWRWQEGPRVGVCCTGKVCEQLRSQGKARASNEALACDPAPGVRKSLAVQVKERSLRLCGCREGESLPLPGDGGPASLRRAWYGDPARPWQLGEGLGKSCLDVVRELLQEGGTVTASNSVLRGDPAPRISKVLLLEVRVGELAEPVEPTVVSGSSQPASASGEDDEGQKCVICLDAPKTHAFTPCGHRCICAACSRTVLASSDARCPVCRGQTSSAMQIFV